MASKSGARTRSRSNRNLKYFFLNGNLYRSLRVNRAEDFVECWNYTEGKRQGLVWSDVRKKGEKAFSLSETAKLIGRTRVTLENAILDGDVKTPQRIYTLDLEKKPGKYMLSESDILELHDYYLTVHIGRPRKDGRITPGRMPSKTELRALMRHNEVLYIKNNEGEFVPVWKEVEW